MSFADEMESLRQLSVAQLLSRGNEIRSNASNRNPRPGSIYLYTPVAHRKLDLIARAISEKTSKSPGTSPAPRRPVDGNQASAGSEARKTSGPANPWSEDDHAFDYQGKSARDEDDDVDEN